MKDLSTIWRSQREKKKHIKIRTVLGTTQLQPPHPMDKMALDAKTNIELDELLREKPTTVIYPPEPVEEQPVNNPTQTMERERLTRYSQAAAKRKNECNLIDRIGVLCGHKP